MIVPCTTQSSSVQYTIVSAAQYSTVQCDDRDDRYDANVTGSTYRSRFFPSLEIKKEENGAGFYKSLNYIKLISNSEDISVLQGTRTNRLLDAEKQLQGEGEISQN